MHESNRDLKVTLPLDINDRTPRFSKNVSVKSRLRQTIKTALKGFIFSTKVGTSHLTLNFFLSGVDQHNRCDLHYGKGVEAVSFLALPKWPDVRLLPFAAPSLPEMKLQASLFCLWSRCFAGFHLESSCFSCGSCRCCSVRDAISRGQAPGNDGHVHQG